MKKEAKKTLPVGCFVYLGVISLAFAFLPWELALGITIFIFLMIAIVYGIIGEIRKIKRRNSTGKSTIASSQFGYTELVAKVIPKEEGLTTWLSKEPAAYRWISVQQLKKSQNSNSENSHYWSPLCTQETHSKWLNITDGSGEAIVSLHMSDQRISSLVKRFQPTEFLEELQKNGLDDFPFEAIDDKEKVKVVEKWIPKDQNYYFYGQMNVFDSNQIPSDLIKIAEDARSSGNLDNKYRRLDAVDWEEIFNRTNPDGNGKTKVLTSNYDKADVDPLIISEDDDRVLNRGNTIAIIALVFAFFLLLAFGIALLYSNYPGLIDEILFILNL